MKKEKIVHLGGGIHRSYEEIRYLKADWNYTYIHFCTGEWELVATTLGILENRLPDRQFYRINRSIIVNIELDDVEFKKNQVLIRENLIFPISRRRRQGLFELVENFSA